LLRETAGFERRADPDPLRRSRPRRLLGDGDEVFQLPDRQVGKGCHLEQISSDLLHNYTGL
jgi:hypothetical protein